MYHTSTPVSTYHIVIERGIVVITKKSLVGIGMGLIALAGAIIYTYKRSTKDDTWEGIIMDEHDGGILL